MREVFHLSLRYQLFNNMKSMKLFFLLASIMASAVSLKGQDFRFITEVGGGFDIRKDAEASYSLINLVPTIDLGDGADAGFGVGAKYDFVRDWADLSIFASAKYRLLASSVTPFVEARCGYVFGLTQGKEEFFISPSLGLKMKHWQFRFAYETGGGHLLNTVYHPHELLMSVSREF